MDQAEFDKYAGLRYPEGSISAHAIALFGVSALFRVNSSRILTTRVGLRQSRPPSCMLAYKGGPLA